MEIVEVESEQSQQKVEESHHNINSTSNPQINFQMEEALRNLGMFAEASGNVEDIVEEEEEEITRVKQNKVMFVLNLIFSLVTGMENLYIFLGEMPGRDVVFLPPTILFRLIFFPVSTYYLCQNCAVITRLYFMVDKILLALILAYIGVMGFILIFLPYTPFKWLYYGLFLFYPLTVFLYIGNFRVMMVYCEWSKLEVILFKFTLLCGSTSFFILGMYYLVGGLRFTRGLVDSLDEKIQNLLLIYINAGFQLFLEMFSRMDSIDGTSDFKNDYKLHCNPEDMEALLKGRQQQQPPRSENPNPQ